MIRKLINKIKGGFGMKDWSLKKKIMVGVAGIAASILGVFAYGKMNKEVQTEDEDFDNEDFDEESAAENVGFESEETAE